MKNLFNRTQNQFASCGQLQERRFVFVNGFKEGFQLDGMNAANKIVEKIVKKPYLVKHEEILSLEEFFEQNETSSINGDLKQGLNDLYIYLLEIKKHEPVNHLFDSLLNSPYLTQFIDSDLILRGEASCAKQVEDIKAQMSDIEKSSKTPKGPEILIGILFNVPSFLQQSGEKTMVDEYSLFGRTYYKMLNLLLPGENEEPSGYYERVEDGILISGSGENEVRASNEQIRYFIRSSLAFWNQNKTSLSSKQEIFTTITEPQLQRLKNAEAYLISSEEEVSEYNSWLSFAKDVNNTDQNKKVEEFQNMSFIGFAAREYNFVNDKDHLESLVRETSISLEDESDVSSRIGDACSSIRDLEVQKIKEQTEKRTEVNNDYFSFLESLQKEIEALKKGVEVLDELRNSLGSLGDESLEENEKKRIKKLVKDFFEQDLSLKVKMSLGIISSIKEKLERNDDAQLFDEITSIENSLSSFSELDRAFSFINRQALLNFFEEGRRSVHGRVRATSDLVSGTIGIKQRKHKALDRYRGDKELEAANLNLTTSIENESRKNQNRRLQLESKYPNGTIESLRNSLTDILEEGASEGVEGFLEAIKDSSGGIDSFDNEFFGTLFRSYFSDYLEESQISEFLPDIIKQCREFAMLRTSLDNFDNYNGNDIAIGDPESNVFSLNQREHFLRAERIVFDEKQIIYSDIASLLETISHFKATQNQFTDTQRKSYTENLLNNLMQKSREWQVLRGRIRTKLVNEGDFPDYLTENLLGDSGEIVQMIDFFAVCAERGGNWVDSEGNYTSSEIGTFVPFSDDDSFAQFLGKSLKTFKSKIDFVSSDGDYSTLESERDNYEKRHNETLSLLNEEVKINDVEGEANGRKFFDEEKNKIDKTISVYDEKVRTYVERIKKAKHKFRGKETTFSSHFGMSFSEADDLCDHLTEDSKTLSDFYDDNYREVTFDSWYSDFSNPSKHHEAVDLLANMKQFTVEQIEGKKYKERKDQFPAGINDTIEIIEKQLQALDDGAKGTIILASNPFIKTIRRMKVNIHWVSLRSIGMVFKKYNEAYKDRIERRDQTAKAWLGGVLFKGTDLGREFDKEAAEEEKKRVETHKERHAADDFRALYNELDKVKNKDELRAISEKLIEVGNFRFSDWDFLKKLSEFQNKIKFDLDHDSINYHENRFEVDSKINSAMNELWSLDNPFNDWKPKQSKALTDRFTENETTIKNRIDSDRPGTHKFLREFLSNFEKGTLKDNEEPRDYYSYLHSMFINGKANGHPGDVRLYYLIKGLSTKDPKGRTLLPVSEVFEIFGGEFMKFPYFDALNENGAWIKDGQLCNENTPGAVNRAWNQSDIDIWGKFMDNHAPNPSDLGSISMASHLFLTNFWEESDRVKLRFDGSLSSIKALDTAEVSTLWGKVLKFESIGEFVNLGSNNSVPIEPALLKGYVTGFKRDIKIMEQTIIYKEKLGIPTDKFLNSCGDILRIYFQMMNTIAGNHIATDKGSNTLGASFWNSGDNRSQLVGVNRVANIVSNGSFREDQIKVNAIGDYDKTGSHSDDARRQAGDKEDGTYYKNSQYAPKSIGGNIFNACQSTWEKEEIWLENNDLIRKAIFEVSAGITMEEIGYPSR